MGSASDDESFISTRPKPAYGRQGLDWDRRARIQLGQVPFGTKTSRHQQGDPTDLLWCWLKEPVCNLVDGSELSSPPELNDVVGERQQLPLEGRGQGGLFLP